MAINYASKAEAKVAEVFKLKSLTESAVNRDYKWVGVDTINVYSLPTTALGDYVLTGTARYGAPAEQQTTVQSMQVAKDRAFAITIDKKTIQDTPLPKLAGKVLKNQLELVIIPEIDTYRLAAMSTAAIANGATATLAITKDNAYISFLNATAWMGDKKVPVDGRVAFCSYSFYSFIKQDPSFILASDKAMGMKVNGVVGEVDGTKIIPVPSSYLPATIAFIMAHSSAMVACDKLEDFTTHDNPPGINGALIEGRERYDAFVLTAKKDALWAHKISI